MQALKAEQDLLACLLLQTTPQVFDKKIVSLALKHANLNFLKILWTGNYKKKEVSEIRRRKNKSMLWDKLEREVIDAEERRVFS